MVHDGMLPDGLRRQSLKVLAIIPARGGSKRIPHKNIRPFHGRPMLHYPLRAANDSGLFSHIHVSTDDDAIAQVAADAGHPVLFKRDVALADDETGLIPVLQHELAEFERQGDKFDVVVLILACTPLMSSHDLLGAMEVYLGHGGKHPVMAVSAFPVPPEWAFEMEEGGILTPMDADAILRNSQTFPERYFDAASFTVFPAHLLRSDDVYNTPYAGYAIPRYRAVDIDVEEDWRLAELIYGGLNCEAS